MVRPAKPTFNCWICNKPINLEKAKTDENGKAVHEECYVLRNQLKDKTQPPFRVGDRDLSS
jgi:hypothetical protein